MRRIHGDVITVGLQVLGMMFLFSIAVPARAAEPGKAEVVSAMKKSTDYMMDTVSNRGGFVSMYTEDLSRQWGEVPARRSMIWVQDPGTVTVAKMLLEVHEATGEEVFLNAARQCADALIWGQLPCGGWNYLIDFEPEGTAKWYEEIGAHAWGWDEFYHFHGNATYDDLTTATAADFLLDLYTLTMDPAYRDAVMKVIEGMLASQYPVGGWPQRYPIHALPDGAGHVEDYSAYLTFNDDVILGNIKFLLKAHRLLGLRECRVSAERGMQFYLISQLGTPQAGWAQQYTLDIQPGAAREYEPRCVAPSQTVQNIYDLLRFYKVTGDRRYLRGIPDALDWLDRERLPEGHATAGQTHAQFVDIGTGKPLYAHREGPNRVEGRYWVDYTPGNFPDHYGMQITIDVAEIRKEYERVFALSPETAMKEETWPVNGLPETTGDEAKKILDAQDKKKGIWIENLSAADHIDWKYRPRFEFRGISTRTWCTNMRALAGYVAE